jgi:branched-chain amino acid aminotransferase
VNLPKLAFFKNQYVPYSEAKIGVLTHAFNYGTAVFGGIRGYWNSEEEQLFVFRPIDHFQRFLNSARLLLMELNQTPESLTDITLELLNQEGYREDIYIRPIAYKSDEIIGVRCHDLHDEFTIVAIPFDRYIKNDTDVHATFSSWRRIDDNVIPARGKISGAYANSAVIKTDAARAGFDEALVLTQDGHVSEGSAMNIFIVREGVVITPPVTDNILEGITRKSAIELLFKEQGVQVVERSIDRTEVYLCEECFMTGSAAQIIAVTSVDRRPIGKGVMGPITSKLRTTFNDVIRGRVAKYRRWTMRVYHEVAEVNLRTC